MRPSVCTIVINSCLQITNPLRLPRAPGKSWQETEACQAAYAAECEAAAAGGCEAHAQSFCSLVVERDRRR